LYHNPDTPYRFIVSVGEAAPEPVGGRFSAIEAFSLNDRGDVAFRARIEGGRSPVGLFLWSEGKTSVVAAAGDPAPLGGVFSGFSPPDPMSGLGFSGTGRPPHPLNNTGTVAFVGMIEGGPSTSGIFLARGDAVHKIAAVGEPTPLGGVFDRLGWPVLNDRDEVAFTSHVIGGTAEQGVFLATEGLIRKIVGRGELGPTGGRWRSLGVLDLNTSGKMVLDAWEESDPTTLKQSLLLASQGRLSRVVTVGDAYPPSLAFGPLGGAKLNDRGDLAFGSTFTVSRRRGGPKVETWLFLVTEGMMGRLATQVGWPDHLSETGGVAARANGPPFPVLSVGFIDRSGMREVMINPPPDATSLNTKEWHIAVNEADLIVGVLSDTRPDARVGFDGRWILLADGRLSVASAIQ
jgi:hypothetical protein